MAEAERGSSRLVDRFRLVGGDPALDFLNTRDGRWLPEAEVQEALEEYGDLLRFARRTGLLEEGAIFSLEEAARRDAQGAREALRRAREVRERLARILGAVVAGEAPDLRDREGFQRDRLDLEAQRRLDFGPEGTTWAWEDPAGLDRPLREVLCRILALLASPLGRLRRCEAPDCDWFFLDRSRNGTRRWCSMETCGNRAKARRHYERGRKTAGGEG